MPDVSFTKENLLERKQLTAGWRKLKVKTISEWGPGKTDPTSETLPITVVVDEGPDLGVPINSWFTEKQMGRLSEFVVCFTGGKIDEGKKYDLKTIEGRHVMGYCEYDIKTGFNTIKDWKPAK